MSIRLSVIFHTVIVTNLPNTSSKVHFSYKHGCKIAVEFLELHWHSVSKRPQPIRGKFSAIHSSCPGQLRKHTVSSGILLRMVVFDSKRPM